jgi:hypothetical protein
VIDVVVEIEIVSKNTENKLCIDRGDDPRRL